VARWANNEIADRLVPGVGAVMRSRESSLNN
jgi:hypothetical protein